jgi:hypothetical protein
MSRRSNITGRGQPPTLVEGIVKGMNTAGIITAIAMDIMHTDFLSASINLIGA